MNLLSRILCLLLFMTMLALVGCGDEERPVIPPDEDPALTGEGDAATDANSEEGDPAL